MASFAYTHVLAYFGVPESGDGAFFLETTVVDGVLSDGEADMTFEPGDTITGASSPAATYVGTTIVNGQPWPVVSNGEGHYSVYMSEAPAPAPDNLDVDETAIFCFAAGTRIATPKGAVAVEALCIGDMILTADGRAVPVKWLGHQRLAPLFQRVRLVRVAAGALGAGLPLRDLVVTADHALMLDGLLVNAGALVNGTTITEAVDLPERLTVYHVETEAHDIILAEGTPTETFIDYAGRRAFDNHADHVALYGEDRSIAENPAPRVTSARHLPPALKARLGITRAA